MENKKFHRKFTKFCEIATASRKGVCWYCILRFLASDGQNLFDEERLERIVNFLLGILLKYDCTDKSIFYKIIEFYFRFHFLECHYEEDESYENNVNSIMNPFRSLASDQKDILLSIVNVETLPICLIDWEFFLVLSKYGIQIGRSIFNMKNAKMLFARFLYVFLFIACF